MQVGMRAHAVGAGLGATAVLLVGPGDLAVAAPHLAPALAASAAAVVVAAAWALKARGRVRRLERALADDRARASERQSAASGPLAAAASRAAAAAHDMAGPIAAIRANLDWLDGALRDGRLADRDGEARAVLEDGHAAVEALVRVLQDFRRASGAARESAPQGGRPGEGSADRAMSGE